MLSFKFPRIPKRRPLEHLASSSFVWEQGIGREKRACAMVERFLETRQGGPNRVRVVCGMKFKNCPERLTNRKRKILRKATQKIAPNLKLSFAVERFSLALSYSISRPVQAQIKLSKRESAGMATLRKGARAVAGKRGGGVGGLLMQWAGLLPFVCTANLAAFRVKDLCGQAPHQQS